MTHRLSICTPDNAEPPSCRFWAVDFFGKAVVILAPYGLTLGAGRHHHVLYWNRAYEAWRR